MKKKYRKTAFFALLPIAVLSIPILSVALVGFLFYAFFAFFPETAEHIFSLFSDPYCNDAQCGLETFFNVLIFTALLSMVPLFFAVRRIANKSK
ncbi:MAG: hypothetical protein LBG89_01445 [Rickettsiales bacterium]|jgi:hypothetical protein|nr:hypothetical protein [Rickettsiales bacterium]